MLHPNAHKAYLDGQGITLTDKHRNVDTHIKTLRQKLGDEGRHIVTLIRSGYKFEVVV